MKRVRLKDSRVRLCGREVIQTLRIVRFGRIGRALQDAQESARLLDRRMTRLTRLNAGERFLEELLGLARGYGEVWVVRLSETEYDVYTVV